MEAKAKQLKEKIVEKQKAVKKKQKASGSYTLKAITANIQKLQELELINEGEAGTMMGIKNNAVNRYVQQQFN